MIVLQNQGETYMMEWVLNPAGTKPIASGFGCRLQQPLPHSWSQSNEEPIYLGSLGPTSRNHVFSFLSPFLSAPFLSPRIGLSCNLEETHRAGPGNLRLFQLPVSGRNRAGRVTLTGEPLIPQDRVCPESPVPWPFAFGSSHAVSY